MSSLTLLQAGSSEGELAVKSVAEGRLHLWGDLFLADPLFLVLVPLF